MIKKATSLIVLLSCLVLFLTGCGDATPPFGAPVPPHVVPVEPVEPGWICAELPLAAEPTTASNDGITAEPSTIRAATVENNELFLVPLSEIIVASGGLEADTLINIWGYVPEIDDTEIPPYVCVTADSVNKDETGEHIQITSGTDGRLSFYLAPGNATGVFTIYTADSAKTLSVDVTVEAAE